MNGASYLLNIFSWSFVTKNGHPKPDSGAAAHRTRCLLLIGKCLPSLMGVSIGGTHKWMVYNGNSHEIGWFWSYPRDFGNHEVLPEISGWITEAPQRHWPFTCRASQGHCSGGEGGRHGQCNSNWAIHHRKMDETWWCVTLEHVRIGDLPFFQYLRTNADVAAKNWNVF